MLVPTISALLSSPAGVREVVEDVNSLFPALKCFVDAVPVPSLPLPKGDKLTGVDRI